MYSSFKLTIEMGNEAMQSRDDVVDALKQVIAKIEKGRDGGFMQDKNGNNVGSFDFTEE